MPEIDNEELEEELDIMEASLLVMLAAAVSKTVLELQAQIETMRLAGMIDAEILNVLASDLGAGGRIFGAFKNSIKSSVINAPERAAALAMGAVWAANEISSFQWITAGGRVCPDCEPRHGEVMTMIEWRTVGVPKSGFSVCGANCRCVLVPEAYSGENLEQPITHTRG